MSSAEPTIPPADDRVALDADPVRAVCWCGDDAAYLDPRDPLVTPCEAVVDGYPHAPRCLEHTVGDGWSIDRDLLGVFPALSVETDRYWWSPTLVGLRSPVVDA